MNLYLRKKRVTLRNAETLVREAVPSWGLRAEKYTDGTGRSYWLIRKAGEYTYYYAEGPTRRSAWREAASRLITDPAFKE